MRSDKNGIGMRIDPTPYLYDSQCCSVGESSASEHDYAWVRVSA